MQYLAHWPEYFQVAESPNGEIMGYSKSFFCCVCGGRGWGSSSFSCAGLHIAVNSTADCRSSCHKFEFKFGHKLSWRLIMKSMS